MKNIILALLLVFSLIPPAFAVHVTVAEEDARIVYSVGGTPDDSFGIPFTFYDEDDIRVFVEGTELAADAFTVTGNTGTDGGYEGGSLTLDTAVSNSTVVVLLDIPLSRTTDFPVSGAFNITSLNTQLDKLVSMQQVMEAKYKRALKLPETSELLDDDDAAIDLVFLEDPTDGSIFYYSAAGGGFVNGVDAAELEDDIASIDDDVTAAAASASAASTSASNAATSETNAATSATTATTKANEAAASAASVDFSWEGQWLTATAYEPSNMVFNDGSAYVATTTHTSGASTEPGTGASWTANWDLMAQQGSAGAGTGDMLAANNLSDVNAATAFANIKQAATDSATGVVELLTDAEAQTGTDTTRAMTAANLQAVTGTESRKGVLELATDAEAQTGTDTARAITPANLQAVTGTESRKGVLELATVAETTTGTDTARAVTPAGVAAAVAAGAGGDFNLISTQTASSSSTLDFTSLSSSCSAYMFILNNLDPSVDGATIGVRTSTNNGSSYDASAGHYSYVFHEIEYSSTPTETLDDSGAAATSFIISTGVGSAAGEGLSGELMLYNPSDATMEKRMRAETHFDGTAGAFRARSSFGQRDSTGDVDAVRFLPSSGNFVSGTIRMYCLNAS